MTISFYPFIFSILANSILSIAPMSSTIAAQLDAHPKNKVNPTSPPLFFVTPSSQTRPAKIAFVDSERILKESILAKIAETKIHTEFSKIDKKLQIMAQNIKSELQKLDGENVHLTEIQRLERQRQLSKLDQDFQAKQRAFRADLNQRRNEEQTRLLSLGNQAVREIAEYQGIDIVFQEGVYVSPRIDITDQVLEKLNQY